MFGKIVLSISEMVSSVSKNWSEARRVKIMKNHKRALDRLRKQENAQSSNYNDDKLALAQQDYIDFLTAFNLEIIAHNKEVGVE